jgi:radical SAM protein with 4Fe4S-binding SPASM domain
MDGSTATAQHPLAAYQHSVEQMRASPYLDYPAHVHLETMAQCNAACSFCPYPTLERQGTKMDADLIAKVIDDLTAIPRALPFQVSPFKVNEPFLDVRLFDVLRLINDKLPQASITLTSNASALTDKQLAKLGAVRNLGYLWISFNDHRPEFYERTMKLDYARTIQRLVRLHRLVMTGELKLRVVVSRVGDGSPDDLAFCHWVKARFPRFEVSVFQRGGWLGQVATALPDVPDVGCIHWFDVSITATGKVAHCCMDGQAQWPIGDVRTQHVLEIYNAPDYRRLRERTLSRRDATPCSTCTFL